LYYLAELRVYDAVQDKVHREVDRQQKVGDVRRHVQRLVVGIRSTEAYDLGGHYKKHEEDNDGNESRRDAVTARLRLFVGAVERLKPVGSTKRANQTDVTDRENDQWNENDEDRPEYAVTEDEPLYVRLVNMRHNFLPIEATAIRLRVLSDVFSDERHHHRRLQCRRRAELLAGR